VTYQVEFGLISPAVVVTELWLKHEKKKKIPIDSEVHSEGAHHL